jgi:hypothetical protein
MKAYADLADLPEDERIRLAAETAATNHAIVGIVTDDEPGKPERYIRKLEGYPLIRIIDRGPGPVKNTVLIRIGPKGH